MRLWHENLITLLPSEQLNGQHRECCALRGNGWGKKHSTVNYVFKYGRDKLYQYHMLVILERDRRGYQTDELWRSPEYRGKYCVPDKCINIIHKNGTIYDEHDAEYLNECLLNLAGKGIYLNQNCLTQKEG